jgi:hypothetical protein
VYSHFGAAGPDIVTTAHFAGVHARCTSKITQSGASLGGVGLQKNHCPVLNSLD